MLTHSNALRERLVLRGGGRREIRRHLQTCPHRWGDGDERGRVRDKPLRRLNDVLAAKVVRPPVDGELVSDIGLKLCVSGASLLGTPV
jgi:hypothetical protein